MKSMKMIKKAQAGFTLIELMIVVAIIGILAAVAIPAYQNYTIKAKIGSALSSLNSLKTAVGLCVQEQGGTLTGCSTSNANAGIMTFVATKELASADVTNGVITATFATGIATGVDGQSFTMAPSTDTEKANIVWTITPSAGLTNDTAEAALKKNNVSS